MSQGRNQISHNRVQYFFNNVYPHIKAAANQILIYVIGNSGSGKSTFINRALGRKMRKIVGGHLEVIDADKPHALMESTYGESETSYPQVFIDDEGNVFCDLPGFKDTRFGYSGMHKMSMQMLSNAGLNSKAVIVMLSQSEIQAVKGSEFLNLINELSSILDATMLEEYRDRVFFAYNVKQTYSLNKEDLLFLIAEFKVKMQNDIEQLGKLIQLVQYRLTNNPTNKSILYFRDWLASQTDSHELAILFRNVADDDFKQSGFGATLDNALQQLIATQENRRHGLVILDMINANTLYGWDVDISSTANTSLREQRTKFEREWSDAGLPQEITILRKKLASLQGLGICKETFKFARADNDFKEFENECLNWLESNLESLRNYTSKDRALSLEIESLNGFTSILMDELLQNLQRFKEAFAAQATSLDTYCEEVKHSDLILAGKKSSWFFNWWPKSCVYPNSIHTRIDLQPSITCAQLLKPSFEVVLVNPTRLSYDSRLFSLPNHEWTLFHKCKRIDYQVNTFLADIPNGLKVGEVWGLRIDKDSKDNHDEFDLKQTMVSRLIREWYGFVDQHPWLFTLFENQLDSTEREKVIASVTNDIAPRHERLLALMQAVNTITREIEKLLTLLNSSNIQQLLTNAYQQHINNLMRSNPQFKQTAETKRLTLTQEQKNLRREMLAKKEYYEDLHNKLIFIKAAFPRQHLYIGYLNDFANLRSKVYSNENNSNQSSNVDKIGIFANNNFTSTPKPVAKTDVGRVERLLRPTST